MARVTDDFSDGSVGFLVARSPTPVWQPTGCTLGTDTCRVTSTEIPYSVCLCMYYVIFESLHNHITKMI